MWKCRLFISSAEYSCKLFKPIFAYWQTAWTQIRLLLEEQSDPGPHCLQKWLLKLQADDKADDSCCDWQIVKVLISQYICTGWSRPSLSPYDRNHFFLMTWMMDSFTCFVFQDLGEILGLLQSGSYQDRKEGLICLQKILRQNRFLS